uniref:Alternative protein APOB n=1 Tax=Homo sapiens TaxID=9606 RepID=L8E8C4_HUMAN|nr:alternative protein APOB [Homo sapiens]
MEIPSQNLLSLPPWNLSMISILQCCTLPLKEQLTTSLAWKASPLTFPLSHLPKEMSRVRFFLGNIQELLLVRPTLT